MLQSAPHFDSWYRPWEWPRPGQSLKAKGSVGLKRRDPAAIFVQALPKQPDVPWNIGALPDWSQVGRWSWRDASAVNL